MPRSATPAQRPPIDPPAIVTAKLVSACQFITAPECSVGLAGIIVKAHKLFPTGTNIGEYKNNKFSGQGTYTFADGSKIRRPIQGRQKERARHLNVGQWVKYVGEFKGGKFVRTATSAATARRHTII
jgi:hypothetical protein